MLISKFWAILILFCFSTLSSLAWALDAESYKTIWVAKGEQASPAAIQQLVALLQEDAETAALLTNVMKKAGLTRVEDLPRLIKTCDSMGDAVGGVVRHPVDAESRIDLPGEKSTWPEKLLKERDSSTFWKEVHGPILTKLWFTQVTVCIAPGQTILNAYLNLVHELTHFEKLDLLKITDLLVNRDEDDFANKEISIPGGELDAYKAQVRALKRLKKRIQTDEQFFLEPYFDKDGNYLNQEAEQSMTDYLLDNYYRNFYRANFGRSVILQYNDAWADLKLIQTFITETEKQANVDEKTISLAKEELGRLDKFATVLFSKFPQCFR